MKKKRKYIYLEKCLIIRILQIYIFSFYDFLFFISLSGLKLNGSYVWKGDHCNSFYDKDFFLAQARIQYIF